MFSMKVKDFKERRVKLARRAVLVRKEAQAQAAKAEAEAIIAPFRVLIDGYEAQAKADGARIEDLMREVIALREEVKALRKAWDYRREDTV